MKIVKIHFFIFLILIVSSLASAQSIYKPQNEQEAAQMSEKRDLVLTPKLGKPKIFRERIGALVLLKTDTLEKEIFIQEYLNEEMVVGILEWQVHKKQSFRKIKEYTTIKYSDILQFSALTKGEIRKKNWGLILFLSGSGLLIYGVASDGDKTERIIDLSLGLATYIIGLKMMLNPHCPTYNFENYSYSIRKR